MVSKRCPNIVSLGLPNPYTSPVAATNLSPIQLDHANGQSKEPFDVKTPLRHIIY